MYHRMVSHHLFADGDFLKARPSGIAQIAGYYPNFKFVKERLDSEIDCTCKSMYVFVSVAIM